MKMFKYLFAAMFASAVGWQAAFAEPDWYPKSAAKPIGALTIGFSFCGAAMNGYLATYGEEFKRYADELGVKVIILDAQVDAARQSDQIRDLIAQQVDGLVVWPLNGKAVVPAVRDAKAAGLPIVIANSNIDPSGSEFIVTFAGPDDFTEGKISGQLMVQALNGKGNVVMMDGLPGYTVSRMRHDGFLEGIKGSQVKVIDSQPADWSQEKAQSVMENYIARYGKQIDGVWSAAAVMGGGSLTAITAAVADGKIEAGHIKQTDATVFGAVFDAIKERKYYGSVYQSPKEDARAALKAGVLAALRQPLPKTIFMDTPAITSENIGQFERPNF